MSEFNIFAKRLDEAFRKSRGEYSAAFHSLECAQQASRDANAWTPGDSAEEKQARKDCAAAKLLLLAVDCIGRITGDSVFAAQSRADLVTVYGKALMQPEALQIELEGVQARLSMLTRPELDAEPEDSRRRIQAAIRAHKKREAEIMALQ